MKTLIICVLLAALVAGACISRPGDGKRSYARYLKEQGSTEVEAEAKARLCEIDRQFLWIAVKENGKTMYVNVFHHWFSSSQFG